MRNSVDFLKDWNSIVQFNGKASRRSSNQVRKFQRFSFHRDLTVSTSYTSGLQVNGCHFLNNPCLVTVSSATEHRQQNQPGSRKVRAETCSSHFHPRNPQGKGSYTMAVGLFTSCLENSFNSVQCLYTVFTGNSTLLVTQKYVIQDAVSLMMNATCLYISDK